MSFYAKFRCLQKYNAILSRKTLYDKNYIYNVTIIVVSIIFIATAILTISEAEKTNYYSISEFMFFQYMLDVLILGGRFDKKTILIFWQLKILPVSLNDLFFHQLLLIMFDFKSLILLGNIVFSLFLMFQFSVLQGLFTLIIFLLVFISMQTIFLNIFSAIYPLIIKKNINFGTILLYGFSFSVLVKTLLDKYDVFYHFPIISWAEQAISFVLNGNWLQGFGFVGLFGMVILFNLFVFRKILVHERYARMG